MDLLIYTILIPVSIWANWLVYGGFRGDVWSQLQWGQRDANV